MMTAIRDVMTPNPITLPITASVVEAALAARSFDVEAVIVLDDAQVRGIVTDHDAVLRSIANGSYPATTKHREVCSRSAC
jgi:CBS domain-containing protein